MAGPALTMPTSGIASARSTSEAVLFVRTGSVTPDGTYPVTVLVNKPVTLLKTVACRVRVALSPAAKFKPFQTPLAAL